MVQKTTQLLTLLLLLAVMAKGQAANQGLNRSEDSLKIIASRMVMADDAAERFRSDSLFTRVLVRALRTPHSFGYSFDSVIQISRLYSPDSAFRIFSWQVMRDENNVRRHGAIQMRTSDGSLKLFPLIDKTMAIEQPATEMTDHENWIGSIYYRIIVRENEGKKLYTLLGYDENNMASTMKRIEVLQFNEQGLPVFGGGSFFSFAEDSIRKPDQARFWIEYKKEGNARMQYDEELNLIIFDHLIPENGEADKPYTFIPDGDYEGFKWEKGKWVHVDKVFHFALRDGEAPVPSPVQENKLTLPTKPTSSPTPRKKRD